MRDDANSFEPVSHDTGLEDHATFGKLKVDSEFQINDYPTPHFVRCFMLHVHVHVHVIGYQTPDLCYVH